jgi:hypothetical protein
MSLNPLLFTISDTNHKIELNPINGFLACDQIIYKILDSCEHLLWYWRILQHTDHTFTFQIFKDWSQEPAATVKLPPGTNTAFG